MAKKKLISNKQFEKENKALKGQIKTLIKELEDLDMIASFAQFDLTAKDGIEAVSQVRENALRKQKRMGGRLGNENKTIKADERRSIIATYLKANPNPDTKNISLANFIIKENNLDVSEKTVKKDLEKIKMEKR